LNLKYYGFHIQTLSSSKLHKKLLGPRPAALLMNSLSFAGLLYFYLFDIVYLFFKIELPF
jgi:hypothetical protein